jgi:uncharacterized protein (DUF58 family)
MVGVMLLSLLLACCLFASKKVYLTASRNISQEKIFEGGEVKVVMELTNRGRKTGFLEIRDTLPRQCKLKSGSNYNFLSLKCGEKIVLKYKIECPLTGLYFIGPITLRVQDAFGFFYREMTLPIENPLTVFPKVDEIKHVKIHTKSKKMYPGSVPIRAPGAGSEFFLIRDYVPGDPFKSINWKARARTGKLLTNETQREIVSDITIIIDSRECSGVGLEYKTPLIYSLRAAATLSSFFLKRRDSVGLAIYGESIYALDPDTGEKQLYSILTALAGAKPSGNIPLRGVVDEVLPHISQNTPIILFSCLDQDETLSENVGKICSLGFELIIIAPSTMDFELLARDEIEKSIKKLKGEKEDGKIERDTLPYDLWQLERSTQISKLRGLGAKVVDWKPTMSLTVALVGLEIQI